jgi:hypothetical protein
VGHLTKIDTGLGDVTIDLTEAEFDDWDVKIVIHTNMGSITVIAPRGLDAQGRESAGPPLAPSAAHGRTAARHHPADTEARRLDTPGYTTKTEPSTADMTAKLRRVIIAASI